MDLHEIITLILSLIWSISKGSLGREVRRKDFILQKYIGGLGSKELLRVYALNQGSDTGLKRPSDWYLEIKNGLEN